MTISWWYESAIYDLDKVLAFARLTVRDDETAEVFTDDAIKREFESEEQATLWLADEEYLLLENLVEELTEAGKPTDQRIRPPAGKTDEELVKRMVVNLKSSPPIPAPSAGIAGAEQVS